MTSGAGPISRKAAMAPDNAPWTGDKPPGQRKGGGRGKGDEGGAAGGHEVLLRMTPFSGRSAPVRKGGPAGRPTRATPASFRAAGP